MTTFPSHIVQTSTEAKKAYKRNGPALPEWQKRRLVREAELEQRAARIRESEERRQTNKKRKQERERKEIEARKRNGVGMATQLIGYSRSQAQMKNAMETYFGISKKREEEEAAKEKKMAKQLEAAVEETLKEPWDDEAEILFDLPDSPPQDRDEWSDKELDDDTLLEVHDLVMSDLVEETAVTSKPPQLASSAPVASKPLVSIAKQDIEFDRLHGPVNKTIEDILHKLPEPLIELLSQDTVLDPALWNPLPALLYKLTPMGLPPHRLRLKVGCVVTLLRDIENIIKLSKGQNLRILRLDKESLECLVLDGQREGTIAHLCRVAFRTRHRNEDKFPFQRLQFPVQVAKDYVPQPTPRKPPEPPTKPTPKPTQAPPPPPRPTKPLPIPSAGHKIQTNPGPSFKLPGLPASKLTMPIPPLKTAPTPPLSDGWDDFLESATQIARELSDEPSMPVKMEPCPKPQVAPQVSDINHFPPLSSQDFDFSLEDLDEPVAVQPSKKPLPQSTKPRISPPITKPLLGNSAQLTTMDRPAPPVQPKRKAINVPSSNAYVASKRVDFKPARSMVVPAPPKPTTSFSDFGLSTQEAVLFFDDDDDGVSSSPPITV